MKKIILGVLLISFIMISYAQNITIQRPKSGELWKRGLTYFIKWKTDGLNNSNFSILLLDSETKGIRKIIATKVKNKNSYTWFIPADVPDGSYIVELQSEENSSVSAVSGVFFIGKRGVISRRIKLLSPPKDKIESICKGNEFTIRWKDSSFTGRVNIKFLRLTNGNICNFNFYPSPMVDVTVPNTGEYKHFIPMMFIGGLYRIKFTKGNYVTYSNCFRVLPHCKLDPEVLKKIKNYKFKAIMVNPPLVRIKVWKPILNLTEVINVLTKIKNGKFKVDFVHNNKHKTLFYVINEKINWFVDHRGNIAHLNNIYEGVFPENLKVVIIGLEKEEKINEIKIIVVQKRRGNR